MADHSIDIEVLIAILDGSAETAAVHHKTASVDDLFHVRQADLPATPVDSWNTFYRPPLEKNGLVSEVDFESRFVPETSTLDAFIQSNMTSVRIDCPRLHIVETELFGSKQDACSTIENCSGWWRFSRVGYNEDQSQALVHTDYDHPKWGLMGMGHFVLLSNDQSRWRVLAKDMTWIS